MDDINPLQLAAVIITLIGVMVAFLVGTAVIDGVSTSAEQQQEAVDKSSSPLVEVGEAVGFQDTSYFVGDVTTVYQVKDSTGEAIRLTGASDSMYRTSESIEIADDDTWTVSVHASWDDSRDTTNGTVVSLNGRVLVQYDNASQQWVGWYYDESTRASHRVNVSATTQPGSLQAVQVVSNGTHVAIYRNNTRGEVDDLRVERSEEPVMPASNWAGRQDELRGYDTALNASSRQSLVDSPVAPVAGESPTYRVLFDELDAGSEPVYFSDAELEVSNASAAVGLPGSVLSSGTDYAVSLAYGSITALDGGRLDGAPTAFVEYEFEPGQAVSDLTRDIGGSMQLFAVVPIVLVAGLLFIVLNQFNE